MTGHLFWFIMLRLIAITAQIVALFSVLHFLHSVLLLILMSIPPCIRPVFILFLIEGPHLPAVSWWTPPNFVPQLRQDFYEESGIFLIFQSKIGVFLRCHTVSLTPTVNMYYIVYSHFIYYTCTIYTHTHILFCSFSQLRGHAQFWVSMLIALHLPNRY